MRTRPVFVVSLLLLSFGCGGGGGASTATDFAYTPATLSASFRQGDIQSTIRLEVVSHVALHGGFFLGASGAEDVIDAENSTFAATGTNTAEIDLRPSCMLAPGTHTGNVTLWACGDFQCRSKVAGGTIPYSFTVSPGKVITATVDGVPVPGIGGDCQNFSLPITANVGQVLTLTSQEPVSWSFTQDISPGFPCVLNPSSTSTTWTATVSDDGKSLNYDSAYNAITVTATAAADLQPIYARVSVGALSTTNGACY